MTTIEIFPRAPTMLYAKKNVMNYVPKKVGYQGSTREESFLKR